MALPAYCTVYQAELLAIRVATREIEKTKALTFGIPNVSMAALISLTTTAFTH